MDRLISELVSYGLKYHLVHVDDKIYVINRLLELFEKLDFQWVDTNARQLNEILSDMNDYAVEHGLIEDTTTNRDLFDTKIMGILTPTPSIVRKLFEKKYIDSPKEATDFCYQFSQASNYIRKGCAEKDSIGGEDIIHKVVEYVARNFREKITLEKMAFDMGVSKYVLSRLFAKTFHCSFVTYVNGIRLNYATAMMKNTSKSITNICYDCGFESQRTFNRVFRERYRMTPREYRRGVKKLIS